MKLLSINTGSSTLKFRLYDMPKEKVLMKGTFDRIGDEDSNYSIRIGNNKIEKDYPMNTHKDAVKALIAELRASGLIKNLSEIKAIGHRVVHGGNKYSNSVIINQKVIKEIELIKDFAPLHNPAALAGINAFCEAIPDATQVACFDTAFHQTIDEDSYLYPIPYEWYVKYDIRKYGFHGMSHKFITEEMTEKLGHKPNLIICHIGNGASITAVKDGISIDTTMGFTPNAGIMMGTRSGDIDYSFIGYLMEKTGLTYSEVDSILNKESGLRGIAGMSDLRDIDRAFIANDKKVVTAINMYTKRIANYIANYYLSLEGKVDAIVFTAGGGENDDIIRKETIKKLKPLGINLDEAKNNETIVRKGVEGIISDDKSTIPVYVLATDEELMIARDAYNLHKRG